jgi:dTDP-4-amino-4,6-dideoxygalactose transaminase
MCGILMDLVPGDEIIMPSFTFVSTSNAFILRGAVIRFADSYPDNPNIDPSKIEALINDKTKAIVVVHYAGIACDMDPIMEIAEKHNLVVVEDAAQAVDSFYKGKALGSIGHLAAFSFHETKNIISGEGGMLVINDENYIPRAEIIREKGTNRSSFFRGEVDKYNWVDIGSSFLPSDLIAAFLFAQLENLNKIQEKRKHIWKLYFNELKELELNGKISLPKIPDYATNNAHMFYIVCKNLSQRTKLITYLKEKGIQSVFHYLSLHKSSYYFNKHDGRDLPWSDHYTDSLLRLPFYYELLDENIIHVTEVIKDFFREN